MSSSPYSGVAMRRGAWQFLTGKAISALLTLSIMLWLVRLLSVTEYGIYTTLVAGMELGFAFAGMGLPWIAARYLPEYRLHASGSALARLCIRLLGWQMLALLVFVMLFSALFEFYLSWAELTQYRKIVSVFIGVFLVEGFGRFLREDMLEPLMLQGQSRSSMILRQLCFLIFIAISDSVGPATLLKVVWVQLTASMLAMVWAFVLLWRHLNGLYSRGGQLSWAVPNIAAQWHIAWRMYVVHLLSLTYSPQFFISVIQHAVGIEAAALFGFLRNLQDQIGHYLPATLLFNLIRPKLVASYISGGGMVELSRNANLIGKLSLFFLMPLIAISALAGEPLVSLLSGGKFTDSGWLLLGCLSTLVPYSQRQLNESVAVASGHAGLCALAAASGIIMLPIFFLLLYWGLGLWSAFIAMGFGHMLFNSVVTAGVSRSEGYRIDYVGFLKMPICALAAYSASAYLTFKIIDNVEMSFWISLILKCALSVIFYLLFAWVIKPFVSDERDRINALAKRRLFIW